MDCALKLGGTAGWAPLLSRVVGWSLWLNAAVSWPCGWLPRIIVQASWLKKGPRLCSTVGQGC